MQTDFYAHFGIPRQFFPDPGLLRRLFLVKSREYHPDFHSLAPEDEKTKAEEMAGLNNKAFEVLQDFDTRLVHLLELESQLSSIDQPKLPQDFLLEMMDLNEALMDLKMDPDETKKQLLSEQIEEIGKQLYENSLPVMQAFDRGEKVDLAPVNDYYFKQKYLRRLKHNLEQDQ